MSLKIFIELFKGREDCYGVQNYCMKEAVTNEIYEKHINGSQRLGVYPLNNGTFNGPGRLSKWIAADIDDGDFLKAQALRKAAEHHNIKAYIERSKSKGYHVWFFFKESIEAYKLRMVLKMLLDECEFKCELFPKQDDSNVTVTKLGNFINLPLFGGNIGEDKTVFIDDEQKTIFKTTEELKNVVKNEISIVDNVIELNELKREEPLYPEPSKLSPTQNQKAPRTPPCIDKIKENGVKKGQRNEATFRLAIYYKERNVPKEDILNILREWNKKNTDSKTPKAQQDREILTTLDSVFRGNYTAFTCAEGALAEYCTEKECPIVHAHDRKKDIQEGIITMVFRDTDIMVFRKKEFEYRLSKFEFTKSGKFKCALTLSNAYENKIILKDVINLDVASNRSRFVKASGSDEMDSDLIKLDDLVRHQLEKEEQERILAPKQPYIMTEQEKNEAVKFLQDTKNILYRVIDITNRNGVVGDETLRLMVYLCFTSRITKEPLSITVKGESSSGKSFSCQNIQKLIPEEGYHFVTKATQQAFFHMPEDGLQNRIVYINELPGSESADYSIRAAQSEGDLILMMPIKDERTGNMETIKKVVKGPVGFLITTTKASMFDENETRNFSVFSDDSPALTNAIGDITIRRAMGEEFNVDKKEIDLWKNVQRLLNPDFKVIIPYAREVFTSFPSKPVRIRRDRERFRVLIEIITILHQYHREQVKTESGTMHLVSTLSDYYIAKLIAGDLLTYTIYETGPSAQEIWKAIKEMEKNRDPGEQQREFTFKYKDIAEFMGWKVEKVKKWIYSLTKAGLLDYADKTDGGKGKAAVLKISKQGIQFSSESLGFLPEVKDLFEKYPCKKDTFYDPINGKFIDPLIKETSRNILNELESDPEDNSNWKE